MSWRNLPYEEKLDLLTCRALEGNDNEVGRRVLQCLLYQPEPNREGGAMMWPRPRREHHTAKMLCLLVKLLRDKGLISHEEITELLQQTVG